MKPSLEELLIEVWRQGLFEQLIKLVDEESRKGDRKLTYEGIGTHSAELAEYVHYIFINHYEGLSGIEVDIPSHASVLPPDGRWIEEGIHKKVQKYGGPEAVKDLMLIIDVAGVVDDEQIDAFRGANPEEGLPFSEIWIVAFHGMVCLKRKAAPFRSHGRVLSIFFTCVAAAILWWAMKFVGCTQADISENASPHKS